MVEKGRVTDIQGNTARISSGDAVTPFISAGKFLRLQLGDMVAYVLFADNTGLVLGRL